MKSASDFPIFSKWLDAPSGAFGSRNGESLVPPPDKEAYWRIYDELKEAAENARAAHPDAAKMVLRPKMYSRNRGSRGHRPVDLWVSICSTGANIFGYMPQVYAIASDRGLEIGFAVSIAEDDYFDPEVKERNRSIVPFINSKLPSSDDLLAGELGRELSRQGSWHFNQKTRLTIEDNGFDAFTSLPNMLDHLKSRGENTGGGAICRLYSGDDLASIDLTLQFKLALANFGHLLARCAPTSWDMSVRVA
ncbi:hypothetical protein [Methylobacterium sp. WL6]|uniref:hypothetical protein n=1 Tax=Methylobacterium sp. WL6 TaxID=2603901 RepID=UPI0011C87DB1|nr:hypothetical protein [Methylobacterium sp. WL6]TXN65361.1 hypothetical protein FV230_17005 [Methylobacterium sp. WL6]